jgi:hypothetical protein
MSELISLENCSSAQDLEETYLEKRSKYQCELKRTSAKPRKRLLEDKILKLDTLYRATKEKIEEDCLNCEQTDTNPQIPSSAGESGEQEVIPIDTPVPDSPSLGKVYPLWFIDGEITEKNFISDASILVDGEEIDLSMDGSFEVTSGERKLEIIHPLFQSWKNTINVARGVVYPMVVKVFPRTASLKLDVFPKVDFRVFVNDTELSRNLSDCYHLPIGCSTNIKILAPGYEDAEFTVSPSEEKMISPEITLIPRIEFTDLLSQSFPMNLRHAKSNREVNLCRGDRFTFGRAECCLVNLSNIVDSKFGTDELFISRKHFTINLGEEGVVLEDHSANGTHVNGRIIKGEYVLAAGKKIEVSLIRPDKKAYLLRLELLLHRIDELIVNEDPSSGLFLSVRDITNSGNNLTHLLLFERFADARNSPESLLPWAMSISVALGATTQNFLSEVRQWIIN